MDPATVVDDEPKFVCDKMDLVKDIIHDDLMADFDALEPQQSDLAECVVLIDGLPAVNVGEKFEKLKKVLVKLYTPFGENATAEYPVDDEGKGKGYCFVEFDSVPDARACVAGLDGHRLDKKHQFRAAILADIMASEKPVDVWTAPETEEYPDPGNLWWYLEDKRCIDQFAVLFNEGSHLSVFENAAREPQLVNPQSSKPNWTQAGIQWSPRGAYLATFHKQGLALWGGEKFVRLQRFAHENVQDIAFSPDEKYLVTYSHPDVQYMEHVRAEDAICIWEVRSGDLLASLPVGGPGGLRVDQWPFLKFSHDSKFVAARREKNGEGTGITVYELPSCKPHKRMINLPGVKEICWSPTQPHLAYWVAESEGRPATVSVLRVPSRDEAAEKDVIATKSPFNVVDMKLHWQASGERLAVLLTRYGKKKPMDKDDDPNAEQKYTNMTYSVQIFHLHAKDVPIDTVELMLPDEEGKNDSPAAPVSFAWEPHGDRFVLLLGSDRVSTPVFYQCKKDGKTVVQKTFDRELNLNSAQWAPHGNWCVLSGLRNEGSTGAGQIIFMDTSNQTVTRTAKQEHPQMTNLEFDPTGRYVVSVISSWCSGGRANDYAYWMYTSQGRCIRKETPDKLAVFSWRPRPPSCLTEKELKNVKKNMKSLAERFEIMDKMDAGRASEEVIARRRAMMADWHSFVNHELEDEKERAERLRLRNGVDTDNVEYDEKDFEEEVIEVLVNMAKDDKPVHEDIQILDD